MYYVAKAMSICRETHIFILTGKLYPCRAQLGLSSTLTDVWSFLNISTIKSRIVRDMKWSLRARFVFGTHIFLYSIDGKNCLSNTECNDFSYCFLLSSAAPAHKCLLLVYSAKHAWHARWRRTKGETTQGTSSHFSYPNRD